MKEILSAIGFFVAGYYLGRKGVDIPVLPVASETPNGGNGSAPNGNAAPQDQAEQAFDEYVEVTGPSAWPYSAPMQQYRIG